MCHSLAFASILSCLQILLAIFPLAIIPNVIRIINAIAIRFVRHNHPVDWLNRII